MTMLEGSSEEMVLRNWYFEASVEIGMIGGFTYA